MHLPFAVTLVLIAIPVTSIFVSNDFSSTLNDKEVSEFSFNEYSDHDCTQIRSTQTWKQLPHKHLEFEVTSPNMMTFWRQFKCTDEVVQSHDWQTSYHQENWEIGSSTWWINPMFKQLISGECTMTSQGAVRLVPPLPKEVFQMLFPCMTTPSHEIETTMYHGRDCSEENLMYVMHSGRTIGGCIDTTNSRGFRYSQDYECVDNAIVEKYYGDFKDCGGTEIYDRVVWTYYRWKQSVSGQCVNFDGFSLQINQPLRDQSVLDKIEKTYCGHPIAGYNYYSTEGCPPRNLIAMKEFVNKETATGCIHVTSHHTRETTMHCYTDSRKNVAMIEFASSNCWESLENFAVLPAAQYAYLLTGACTAVTNAVNNITGYHQIHVNDLTQYPLLDLKPCDLEKFSALDLPQTFMAQVFSN